MSNEESKYWDEIAGGWHTKGYHNELLAEHKRKTYLNLIERWAHVTSSQRILKTDLFAEAFEVEQFLFEIARTNKSIVGVDVSKGMVAKAKRNAERYGVNGSKYLCCDVRWLPFKDNSFDLIISDSTLDHFPNEAEIILALKELSRVLRVGSVLILTIDNKNNLTYPPYFLIRVWMRLKLSPYFIGKTLSLKKLRQALKETGLSVVESTAIFHYPHPDRLVRWLERFLRKVSAGRFDNAIRKGLALLDLLERKRTKYLTGRYLAVKAVKQR